MGDLKTKFDFAGRGYFGAAALGAPALHVHSHGVARDVCPGGFNVHRQGRGIAAKPLRADAGLIDSVEKFLFQGRDLWIGIL